MKKQSLMSVACIRSKRKKRKSNGEKEQWRERPMERKFNGEKDQ